MLPAGNDVLPASHATPGRAWLKDAKDFASGRAPHRFLLLIVVTSLAFLFWGIRNDSPTEDEWAHLTRGISYWQNRDMRIHVQHPPLANAIAGIPSAFAENPDMTSMKTWQDGYAPGLEYIKLDYARALEQLAVGRYMMSLFYVGLLVYVFYFCSSFFGWPTAAAATILVAFNPTILGQARYVATDMPAATFAAVATGELVRYLARPGRASVVTLGLALGGVVLSKHSGVVFVAIVLVVALAAAVLRKGRFRGQASLWRRLATSIGHFVVAGLIVLVCINAIYKFHRTAMRVDEILATPEPKHWTTKRHPDRLLEETTPLPHLPAGLRIPLPYPYLVGLFGVREQNAMGYPTYFMGRSSRYGHWAYFPVLLAVKDPPALLFLLGLGAALLVAPAFSAARPRRLASVSLPTGCFVAVASLFLAFVMRSNLNMGVRHALPIIPLASVVAARAFSRAGELLRGRWLLGGRLFGLSGVVSALFVAPHYLNYYNVFALGQGSWINVVGDDWGQDREAFVRFAKKHELRPLYYHTQTPTRKLEVDHLGLEYQSLGCKTKPKPGSWVAVHAQYVRRWEGSSCAPWMRALEPHFKVNDNVWIYKIPERPKP
jgi:hypothetical protein